MTYTGKNLAQAEYFGLYGRFERKKCVDNVDDILKNGGIGSLRTETANFGVRDITWIL